MGSTRWSDEHYHDRAAYRAKVGAATFAHHDAVVRGAASGAHDTLNPKDVKVRECRDSEAHPQSHAVAVFFDVTGSMNEVPRMLQAQLPKLLGLLIRKGYLEHPAIMMAAVGDATCDNAPLQVGQFESGIEIEDCLTNIYLEGGGGGQQTESYELALYFTARHTSIDCFEKRGEKGYLFLIGDELPYNVVKRREVRDIIGDRLQSDIPVEEIIQELQQKWVVFYILPKMTSYYDDPNVIGRWKKLLGQHFLRLEDPNGICELIASQIGVCEGQTDVGGVREDLEEFGATTAVVDAVGKALVAVSPTGAVRKAHGADIAVPGSGAPSGITSL